jgi:hypothetical protein
MGLVRVALPEINRILALPEDPDWPKLRVSVRLKFPDPII